MRKDARSARSARSARRTEGESVKPFFSPPRPPPSRLLLRLEVRITYPPTLLMRQRRRGKDGEGTTPRRRVVRRSPRNPRNPRRRAAKRPPVQCPRSGEDFPFGCPPSCLLASRRWWPHAL